MEARAIVCLLAVAGLPFFPKPPAPKPAAPAPPPAVVAKPPEQAKNEVPAKPPTAKPVARPKNSSDPAAEARPQPSPETPPRIFAGNVIYVEGMQIGRGSSLCSLLLAEPEVRVFGDMSFLTGRNIGSDAKVTAKRVWVPLKSVTRIEEFDSIEAMAQVVPVRFSK